VNRKTALFCGAALILVIAAFAAKEWLSSAPLSVPERPPNVPVSAKWIGEEWVRCESATTTQSRFTCEFYDDTNGRKLQEGMFIWRGRGDAPVSDGQFLQQPGWDGNTLTFDSGQLVPIDETIGAGTPVVEPE
jgi:hypothetical protein